MSPSPTPKRFAAALPVPVNQIGHKIGDTVLSAINLAVETGWDSARTRASNLVGDSTNHKVERLSSLFAKELGLVGAAAGGAAAVPGLAMPAVIAAGVAEFGYFTLRSGELILTIGALHGHTQATVEEQRAWILSVLLFGNAASEGFIKLAGEVGKGLGAKAVKNIPMSVLKSINGAAGRTIVTKYGTKRGAIALGRVLPFGVGMAIGGGANYASVRIVARQANRFFETLPYSGVVMDVEGEISAA